ncbi:peptidoglycan-binding domain-containing protein [Marinobacter sp. SS5-14b]|uniref:peptidoglycan-binding domain-containing protein n=1 Tax=Marinobacter sp. SS5-14b TaxID=3050456 RepID=UPI0026E0FD6B|nr:peptidoglycan-binding domain-containing protein [Marinobacter sp. SS5-14b]
MKTVTRRFGKAALAVGAVALLGLASVAQANDIVALKHALYGAGYNISDVGPSMDDDTRAELVRFQKDHGLEASGVLTEETEKALGMISVQQAASSGGAAPAAAPASASAEPVASESEQPAEQNASEEADKDEDEGWSLW